jgi:hypothetical protein
MKLSQFPSTEAAFLLTILKSYHLSLGLLLVIFLTSKEMPLFSRETGILHLYRHQTINVFVLAPQQVIYSLEYVLVLILPSFQLYKPLELDYSCRRRTKADHPISCYIRHSLFHSSVTLHNL